MPSSLELTEDKIFERVLAKIKESIEDEKVKNSCHLGIDATNGKKLLVADTIAGRAFFWIEIKDSKVLISTPTRAFQASVENFL